MNCLALGLSVVTHPVVGTVAPPTPSFLLLEDGFYLLQEDDVSKIIL